MSERPDLYSTLYVQLHPASVHVRLHHLDLIPCCLDCTQGVLVCTPSRFCPRGLTPLGLYPMLPRLHLESPRSHPLRYSRACTWLAVATVDRSMFGTRETGWSLGNSPGVLICTFCVSWPTKWTSFLESILTTGEPAFAVCPKICREQHMAKVGLAVCPAQAHGKR
jgi:hypothetical protein